MYVNATMWVGGSNGYGFASGYYDFLADGKMYIPDPNGPKAIISEGGYLYFTIDGVKQKNGLNELDGEYYYAQTNGRLVTNATVWVNQLNGLLDGKNAYYAFDAEGKLIKTGFVTGGGYTYYYNNGVRATGFTKIGDDYYIFNTASGKMYKDANMYVAGSNPYGIKGGTYYFDEEGKMVIN